MKLSYYFFVGLLSLLYSNYNLCMEKEKPTIVRRHSLASSADSAFTPFSSPVPKEMNRDKLTKKETQLLLSAAKNNDTAKVKTTLEQGADCNAVMQTSQKTALHFAVQHNNPVMVHYLILRNAHIFAHQQFAINHINNVFPLSLIKTYYHPAEKNAQLEIFVSFARVIIDQKLKKEYEDFTRYVLQLTNKYIMQDDASLENDKINKHVKIIQFLNYYLQKCKNEDLIPNAETIFSLKPPTNNEKSVYTNCKLANGFIITSMALNSEMNSIMELYNKNPEHPKIKLYTLLTKSEKFYKKTGKKIEKIKNKYQLCINQEKFSESIKSESI